MSMKILFLTYGPEIVASSRTRVFQYLPYLKKNKINYKVITYKTGLVHYLSIFQFQNLLVRKLIFKAIGIYDLFFSIFQTLRFVYIANYYDLIFIQKVLLPNFIIKFLKRRKKKIIFDFDDAIYADQKTYNKEKFDTQIVLYDAIILENIYTKRYVNKHGNKKILMITGPIDCKHYHPKKGIKRDKVVMGWIGISSTEQYLKILKNVFKKLSILYENLIFELVGAQKINLDGVRFTLKRWNLNTEVADLQNFDIGIIPLPDNAWTRGKGGYKLLQYMAVGIPAVASPVGVNKEIIQDGINGFLANSEEEWIEKLSLLIENPELRYKLGMKGRQTVEKSYSLKVNAPKSKAALEKVYNDKF